jgi:hypothetical protein
MAHTAKSAGDWEEEGVEEEDGVCVDEDVEDESKVTYLALTRFYEKHDPKKATPDHVSKALATYAPDELRTLLTAKYGEAPQAGGRGTGGGDETASAAAGQHRQARANFTDAQMQEHLSVWTGARGWANGVGFCTIQVE